jgi:ubiquinone/menaquinone biosynthesis C-methylase UbiE
MSFHSKSYELHAQTYASQENSAEQLELYRNWFDNGSVDVWRHLRMLEGLNPFLQEYRGASWLTVGDGHFGTSAIYITRHGSTALPTDIDTTLLQVAKAEHLIQDFRNENAEHLRFEDDSFDFSFCKESFHHFPQPYLALYEMLRCSRNAVLFSEPKDFLPLPLPRRLIQLVKHFLKKLLGKRVVHSDTGNYEPIGNYVFTISRREFQKIAIAMNLPMVAFKEFNDTYYAGVEQEKVADNGKLFRKIRRENFIVEILSRLGLSQRNRIFAVIFKKEPSPAVVTALSERGFEVIRLPENPYV